MSCDGYDLLLHINYLITVNMIFFFFFTCICRDLLYKPIVLCKLIVVSVKTSEILKFLFSLNFSFVSSLWWQLVVTFHVSGVSIDR